MKSLIYLFIIFLGTKINFTKNIYQSHLDCQIINCDAAQKLLNIGKEKSIELGLAMNIAIVDRGANLVAFLRLIKIFLQKKSC